MSGIIGASPDMKSGIVGGFHSGIFEQFATTVDTEYQNTTGRTIIMHFSFTCAGTSGTSTVIVGPDTPVATTSGPNAWVYRPTLPAWTAMTSVIAVPNNHYYTCNVTNDVTLYLATRTLL